MATSRTTTMAVDGTARSHNRQALVQIARVDNFNLFTLLEHSNANSCDDLMDSYWRLHNIILPRQQDTLLAIKG